MGDGRVFVVGSINMDVVARVAAHPAPGETVAGRSLDYVPGGKGANQAVAAARLGSPVTLAGAVGDDAFGDRLLSFLGDEDVDIAPVRVVPDAATGTALIVVDDAGENEIVVVPGSNDRVTPDDVAGLAPGPDDVVLAQFEVPQETVAALFRRAAGNGATTVLNPAPAAPYPAGLAAATDYVVVNEPELGQLAGGETPETDATIARQAREMRHSPEQAVVVTRGGDGVVAVAGEETVAVDGHSVDVVDTTAAGDCFTGALATALLEDDGLAAALRFATAAAAVSVQHHGASPSLPDRAVVDRFRQAD